jgi:hypothetical protein
MELNKNIKNILIIIGQLAGYIAIATGIIMVILILSAIFEI